MREIKFNSWEKNVLWNNTESDCYIEILKKSSIITNENKLFLIVVIFIKMVWFTLERLRCIYKNDTRMWNRKICLKNQNHNQYVITTKYVIISGRFGRAIITTKDGIKNMLRSEVWNELRLLDDIVQNITVFYDDEYFSYKDICAKWNTTCFYNDILNLDKIMDEVRSASYLLTCYIWFFIKKAQQKMSRVVLSKWMWMYSK